MSPEIFHLFSQHYIIESVADKIDHFADAFVLKVVAYSYDFVKTYLHS